MSCSDHLNMNEMLHYAQELEKNRKKRDASAAYLEIALMYIDTTRYAEAKKFLTHSIQLNRSKGEAWFQLGLIEMKDHCYHRAKGLFKKAVSTRPTVAEHHVEYGVVQYMLREWEAAVKAIRESLKHERTSRGLQYLGLALFELGLHDEALESLREAHELSAEEREIIFSLGCSFFRAGHTHEALIHLQKSVEDSNHQRIKVKKRIRDALDIGKDRVESWMCLGNIYERIDRRWEATVALEIATRVDPEHARAWYELSELHLDYELYDGARENAWFLDPKDPDILCSNGVGFYEIGMKKEALDTFEEVLCLDSDHGPAQCWVNKIEEEFAELEAMGHSPRLGFYGYYCPDDDY